MKMKNFKSPVRIDICRSYLPSPSKTTNNICGSLTKELSEKRINAQHIITKDKLEGDYIAIFSEDGEKYFLLPYFESEKHFQTSYKSAIVLSLPFIKTLGVILTKKGEPLSIHNDKIETVYFDKNVSADYPTKKAIRRLGRDISSRL